MSKKNKNKNSSSHKAEHNQENVFNVKENLKKLRHGKGDDPYKTESDIIGNKKNNKYTSTGNFYDFSSFPATSTEDRFEKINDKFSSDISGLKNQLLEHREKNIANLNEKFDKKDFKWWLGGIIGGIIFVGGLIYNLSYQNIVSDVNELKDNKIEFNRRIDKSEFRIEQLEKIVPNSILPNTKIDSSKEQKSK